MPSKKRFRDKFASSLPERIWCLTSVQLVRFPSPTPALPRLSHPHFPFASFLQGECGYPLRRFRSRRCAPCVNIARHFQASANSTFSYFRSKALNARKSYLPPISPTPRRSSLSSSSSCRNTTITLYSSLKNHPFLHQLLSNILPRLLLFVSSSATKPFLTHPSLPPTPLFSPSSSSFLFPPLLLLLRLLFLHLLPTKSVCPGCQAQQPIKCQPMSTEGWSTMS